MRAGYLRSELIAAALAAAAAALALIPSAAAAAQPNVVVVVTDDQTAASMTPAVMPQTLRKIAGAGTSFEQAIVATPQCCPSRAGFLTGQYPQNNGVTANRPGYSMLEDKREVLPSWLRQAGYRTIHIGKYLNGYQAARGRQPAPGWTRWFSLIDADYDEPVFSVDGDRVAPKWPLTEAINRYARRTIKRYAGRSRPFYLQIDQLAPHVGSGTEAGRCTGAAIPDPRDARLFGSAEAPRGGSYNEADTSDKPDFFASWPPFDPTVTEAIDHAYGCALASLRGVDRGIGTIVKSLRSAGALADTMIVFTSDNGYSYGEHRIALRKGLPYEEHLRVPLLIRPPRGFPKASRSGLTLQAPVANIDLAPTILSFARAEPCRGDLCRRLDGRSLRPLLRGREPGWTGRRAIRTAFFINNPTYRLSCRWDGLRSPAESLIHHTSLPDGSDRCQPADEWEHYDLAADPDQLDGDLSVSEDDRKRLADLARCSGIQGRDELIPGTPFCR